MPKKKTPRKIHEREKNGEPTKYSLMRRTMLSTMKVSTLWEDFCHRMHDSGYDFDPNFGGKYAKIKRKSDDKWTRIYHCGDEFTRRKMQSVFDANRQSGMRDYYAYYWVERYRNPTFARPRHELSHDRALHYMPMLLGLLSFTDSNPKTIIQKIGGRQGDRIYGQEGLSCTLTSSAGGFAGNTGLYSVGQLPIKSLTKSGYQIAEPGDSIDLAYPNLNSRRGRVGKQIAHTLTTGSTQGVYCIDMNPDPKITELARCITARQDSGIGNRRGEHSGVLEKAGDGPCAFLNPERETVRQQGRRMKGPEEPMFTLTTQDLHGIAEHDRIRKLMPIECWRLQGFTDEQFLKAQSAGLSDARLYKMAGNAVSVPVITALGAVIKRMHERKATEVDHHAESCNQ